MMFDRTAWCIKREMNSLSWMSMCDGRCDVRYVMWQGVGGLKLDEVSDVAGSIHINLVVLFFPFSFFLFHVSCFTFQKYIRHDQCEFHQEDV
jgi:hypothetical protein